jgi:hypothetical protein
LKRFTIAAIAEGNNMSRKLDATAGRRRALILAALATFAATPALAVDIGLKNASFESQGTSDYCYFNNPGNTSCGAGVWSMPTQGTSGVIDSSDGAWPAITPADGDYFGFIQSGGYIQQTFVAAATGDFTLSWDDAGRAFHGGSDGDQTYELLIDDLSIFSGGTASGQSFTDETSNSFHLVAGQSYTLKFQGHASADETGFIDAISANVANVAGVPEPATWALMLGGFGGLGAMLRRRRALASLATA